MTLLFLLGGAGSWTSPSGFGVSLDHADNEFDLADGDAYRALTLDAPDPELKSVWASSFDTEGSIAVEHQYENREVTIKLRVFGGTSQELLDNVSSLEQKVARMNRKKGTLRLTYPPGNYVIFDVEKAQSSGPTLDQAFISRFRTEMELKFTCLPFYREAELGLLLDPFDADSIATGEWAFDAGIGTATVGFGALLATTTAAKRLYRTDRRFYDAQVDMKVHTPATGTIVAGPMTKRLDANNYLSTILTGSGFNVLALQKTDGGTTSNLATTSFTPSAATAYWVRVRQEGNKLTAEIFDIVGIVLDLAGDPSATPLATCTHTLSGANATKFGAGVEGDVGIVFTPGASDAYVDNFEALPNVWKELTLPALISPPIYGIKGDVPALGKATVRDLEGADQWQVDVGYQGRHTDLATTAQLYYAASLMTVVGTTSNLGFYVSNSDLIPTWQQIHTSDLLSGGSLTHKGSFRLIAQLTRPVTNAGEVSVRLEWAEGDYLRRTLNDVVTSRSSTVETVTMFTDLGLVHISPDATQWEFRLLAKSTVTGDEIQVIDYMLFPVGESYIRLAGLDAVSNPADFLARDEFDHAAGNLAGKTAPVGGNWAGTGSAADFTTGGSFVPAAIRTANDGGAGRFETLPTVHSTAIAVQTDFQFSATAGLNIVGGLLARYVDTSSFLRVTTELNSRMLLRAYVGGVMILHREWAFPQGQIFPNFWYTIRLIVDTMGRYAVWVAFKDGPGGWAIIGAHPAFKTGGFLDDGKVGLYDWYDGAPAATRLYDNFGAWVPIVDAAIFAGKSLELTHETARRFDYTDNLKSTISTRRGQYLRLLPSGPEERPGRMIVKGFRNNPLTTAALNNDNIGLQLSHTPRGLSVPSS